MTSENGPKRRALLERFTAGTVERLERMLTTLEAMALGRATGEQVRLLLREMHTMKGEARMMGFPMLGDAGFHGERLLRADPGAAPSAATCNAVKRLVEASIAHVQAPDATAPQDALRAAFVANPVSWPGGGPAGPPPENPASDPALLIAGTPPPSKKGGKGKKVLLVDDSPVIRELIADVLVRAGFLVDQAADGAAALEKFDAVAPDLMLLDIDMPRMTGFQVLHKLSKLERRCPVVMLSSHSSDEDRAQARSLGAQDYVVKSDFQDEALVAMVRRNLAP